MRLSDIIFSPYGNVWPSGTAPDLTLFIVINFTKRSNLQINSYWRFEEYLKFQDSCISFRVTDRLIFGNSYRCINISFQQFGITTFRLSLIAFQSTLNFPFGSEWATFQSPVSRVRTFISRKNLSKLTGLSKYVRTSN